MSRLSLKKEVAKNSKDDNRFYIAMIPALAIAQFFGLLPITGIFSININNIKFKLISFRTLHTSLWFIGAFIFLYLELVRMVNDESFDVKSIGGIAFYSVGISSAILYVRIAYKWNELLNYWKKLDQIFCSNLYPSPKWSLKSQIKFTTIAISILAALEHAMFWYSFLYKLYMQVEVCNWKIESWVFYIFTLQLYNILKAFPKNILTIIWGEYMNVSLTFAWNYVDLFIMVMSLSLASKFRMINERLKEFKGKILPEICWEEIRSHYSLLCDLNDYIGDMIGSLICVACIGDLYAIVMQLFRISNYLPYEANKIYFWYSTGFLIFRTFSMFLITASVNDESVKPLAIFRSIPADGWNRQVERFHNQIQLNGTALSGRRFFFLNRSIIISIVGTVITYELVLLQFNEDRNSQEKFDPCGGVYNQTISY